MAVPVRVKDRKTQEYREGRKAYEDRAEEDDCPYPKGDGKRLCWCLGYFDARINHRLKEVLHKEGQRFP